MDLAASCPTLFLPIGSSWSKPAHFDQFSAVFEIHDPAEFVLSEAKRLRERYPRVMVAPLLYQIRVGLLYQIAEGEQTL